MDIFIALTILTTAVALAFMAGRRYEAHHAEHQDVTVQLTPLGRAVVARLRSEGITLPLLTGKV